MTAAEMLELAWLEERTKMADSATEKGSSNATSDAERAGAGERSIVPETDAGTEAAGEHAEPNDVGKCPNDAVPDDGTEVNAAGPEAVGRIRGRKRTNRGVAVPELLEAARASSEPAPEARFRVFVIDTGWNAPAHRVLRRQIPLFDTLIGNTPTYWLDRKTSVALLRKHQELIGRDPILVVHDPGAVKRSQGLGVHGLRIYLGLLRSEHALARALQMVIHFLARHEASGDLEAEVHSRLQLEGLTGAVAIMAGGTPHKDLLKL